MLEVLLGQRTQCDSHRLSLLGTFDLEQSLTPNSEFTVGHVRDACGCTQIREFAFSRLQVGCELWVGGSWDHSDFYEPWNNDPGLRRHRLFNGHPGL